MAKAWLDAPDNFGTAVGYTRFDAIWPIVRQGKYTVIVTASAPLTGCTIIAYACDANGQRELDRAVLTAAPWRHQFDVSKWPEGHVVFDCITAPAMPFLWGAIIVCNTGKPVTVQQWIPIGATNGKHAFSEIGCTGFEWVRYEDGVTPLGASLKPRPFLPVLEADFKHNSKGARTWGQPQHDALWQEPITACGAIPPHEFVYITDNGRDSFVTISAIQPYTQNDDFRLYLGQNRDGPYGVGRVGCGINLWPEDDAVDVLAPNGRDARVYIDGPRKGETHTIFGRRLKDPSRPAPRPPMGTFTFWDWLNSFYEQVGTITDGSPTLDSAWQKARDERNPSCWWYADAENSRLVYYDESTRKGFTWAGSLDGSQGFIDGVGTAARFRKVRGVVVKYGATPADDVIYIADDHNSALRASNRDRVITTVVQSQRALGIEADMGRGVNYALVALPQTGGYGVYIPAIRSHLKDGPFESAIWMHPNQLALDSDGNILAACHHPHNVIRFDLTARTIKTVCNLSPLMQAGKLDLSWITLSVDRYGVMGQVDNIAVGYFLDATTLVFAKDGTPLGRYWGNDGNTIVSDQYLMQGSLRYAIHTGYPWGVCYSQNPAKPYMAYTPTVGEGLFLITHRLATDPVPDVAKYQRGANLVASGVPPAWYRRGHFMSKLGEPSAYDFVGKSDDELRAWIRTWPQAAGYSDADIDAIACYERWNAQHVLAVRTARPVNDAPPLEVDPRVHLRELLAAAHAAAVQASVDAEAAQVTQATAALALNAEQAEYDAAVAAANDAASKLNSATAAQAAAMALELELQAQIDAITP